MRIVASCLAIALLAACQPPVPNDTQSGVGFESYGDYQKRRALEAKMAVQPAPAPGPVNQLPVTSTPSAGALLLQSQSTVVSAPLNAVTPQPAVSPPVASTVAAAPETGQAPSGNVGISDEQDFGAVASRETIASDKQRIDQNKAQFQQIAPTELPQRSGNSAGPDLIEYAINAPNRLGQPTYKRGRGLFSNTERACARYATPEDAQVAFLKAGGPQRDRKNLDPDGDGFACFWDPTPFQKVRG
ncbi:MAG: hypothetical protein WBO29_12635 [Albidovulum sp.]